MSNFYPQVKRPATIFLILPLIMWGFYITPAHAALGTFEPSYDTSILINEPKSYFGDIKFLTVFEKKFPIGESRVLVGFDLSSIPADSIITSATLRLFVNNTENISQDLEMYRNTARWTESTTNWISRPKLTNEASLRFRVSGIREDFIELDLKDDVQGFVSGDLKNYGWTILAPNSGTGGANFSSREDSLKERRPRLTVRYADANGQSGDYINDSGDFSAYSASGGNVATKNISQKNTEKASATENGEANAITAEGATSNWHENILVLSVLVIFSMMFYIFWKKDRQEADL
jgi:hypothetical protein